MAGQYITKTYIIVVNLIKYNYKNFIRIEEKINVIEVHKITYIVLNIKRLNIRMEHLHDNP